jgi:hypothetical protein
VPNNAKIAGILTIVSGAFGVLWFVWAVFVILMIISMFTEPYSYSGPRFPPELFPIIIITFYYSVLGLFYVLVGILGIVGGVFALKKKNWGLALAGAIAGTVTFFPCGIPAIIYVTMAKPEFSTPKLPTPAEPPAQ